MHFSSFKRVAGISLTCFASTIAAQAQTIPFVDTFSGLLRGNNFEALSAWRTDTGSVNGGQLGNTSIRFNDDLGQAHVTASAVTISNGFFTARNSAILSVTNSEEVRYISQSSHGTHTTVEFFSPTVLVPARTVFHWRVSGSISKSDPRILANADLRFAAGYFPTSSYYDFFDMPTQENGGPLLYRTGGGDFSYQLPLTLNQPIDLFYHSVAYVSMNTGLGESFSGFSNFSNTHELERIDLFDSNDVPIPIWSMTDRSNGQIMFTQDGRTAAANGVTAPEPGTLALAMLGVAGLVVRLRNRAGGKL
jgi:hypothetical protein